MEEEATIQEEKEKVEEEKVMIEEKLKEVLKAVDHKEVKEE